MARTTKPPRKRLTKVQIEERRNKALQMRTMRASFQAIADKHYYGDKANAYRDIMRALKDIRQESADDVRAIELESIDQLERAFWGKALQGDAEAFDRVMRAKERRARYLGLDAPKDVHLGGDSANIQVVVDATLAKKTRSEPELVIED